MLREFLETGIFGVVNDFVGDRFFVVIKTNNNYTIVYEDGTTDEIKDDKDCFNYEGFFISFNYTPMIIALIEANNFENAKQHFQNKTKNIIWSRELPNMKNIYETGLFGVVDNKEYFVLIEEDDGFKMIYEKGGFDYIGNNYSDYSYNGIYIDSDSREVSRITALVKANSFDEAKYHIQENTKQVIAWR